MAGTELAQAYVQIIPSAKGIGKGISDVLDPEAGPAGVRAGQTLGSSLVGKIKGIITVAAIGKTIGASLTEGGALQQSLGGVETLFKESADIVKRNAEQAYKTVGLSANEYMEQTTGFAASLLQSLGGDTQKAAKIANMAMIDMSDNANKMGTDMGAIQFAYQGFAKQNYTMLDNLKLGYGGTQKEMERLLADAEKLTGVHYDISNLSDVYEAIHVIQGELGITGTTAKEAATTLAGSFAAMQSAFKNVIGNLSLGEDIKRPLMELGTTVQTFLLNNLFPMIGNILQGLPDLIDGYFTQTALFVNGFSKFAPNIIQQGAEIVTNLVAGIITNIPYMVESAMNLIVAFGSALVNTDWIGIAMNMISKIKEGLDISAMEILGTDGNIVGSILNAIVQTLPRLGEAAIAIIQKLGQGLIENIPIIAQAMLNVMQGILNDVIKNLPLIVKAAVEISNQLCKTLVEMIPQLIPVVTGLIMGFFNFVVNNLPTIIKAAVEIIKTLVQGLIARVQELVPAVVSIIQQIFNSIANNLPTIIEGALKIIMALASGLIQAIPNVVKAIPQIVTAIRNAITGVDWLSLGKNIISGIARGIANGVEAIVEAARNVAKKALDAAKSFLGIHSPSTVFRDQVGVYMAEGMAIGFEDEMDNVKRDMQRAIPTGFDLDTTLDYNYNLSSKPNSDQSINYNLLVAAIVAALKELKVQHIMQIDGKIIADVIFPIINALLGEEMELADRGVI